MASELNQNGILSPGFLAQRGTIKSFNASNPFKVKGLTMRLAATHFNFTKNPNLLKSPKSLSQPGTPCRGLDSPNKMFSLQKQTSRFEKKMMFLERIRENRKVAKDIFKSPSPIEMDYPEPEVLAHDYDDSIYDNMFIDLPLINLSVKDEDEGFISEPEELSINGDDVFRYPDENCDDLYPPSPSPPSEPPSLSDIECDDEY